MHSCRDGLYTQHRHNMNRNQIIRKHYNTHCSIMTHIHDALLILAYADAQ